MTAATASPASGVRVSTARVAGGCGLLLVDAKNLLWRNMETHAELSVKHSDGTTEGTGAIHGFLSSVWRIHARHGGRVIITWEGENAKSFRRALFPGYKLRVMTDEIRARVEDMGRQEQRLRALLSKLGVRQCRTVTCEADDVMGTLALRAAARGVRVRIYTGDSDLRQLVNSRITVVCPGYGGAEDTLYDEQHVIAKHGVTPAQIPHLKALTGDTSDTIPGVDGIGAKSGVKLIQRYGSVEATIAAANANDPEFPLSERLRGNLVSAADEVRVYLMLTTIRAEADVQVIPIERDIVAARKEMMRLRFVELQRAQDFTGLVGMGE